MSFPVQMSYSAEVYHNEILSNELSIRYEGTVLCGMASGDVDVYDFGLPGPFGSEFQFYYNNWKDISCPSNLSVPVKETDPEEWRKYLLALTLSATNGWGHANSSRFKPKYSSNTDSIDEE